MSHVSDLTCNETMPVDDEQVLRDPRRLGPPGIHSPQALPGLNRSYSQMEQLKTRRVQNIPSQRLQSPIPQITVRSAADVDNVNQRLLATNSSRPSTSLSVASSALSSQASYLNALSNDTRHLYNFTTPSSSSISDSVSTIQQFISQISNSDPGTSNGVRSSMSSLSNSSLDHLGLSALGHESGIRPAPGSALCSTRAATASPLVNPSLSTIPSQLTPEELHLLQHQTQNAHKSPVTNLAPPSVATPIPVHTPTPVMAPTPVSSLPAPTPQLPAPTPLPVHSIAASLGPSIGDANQLTQAQAQAVVENLLNTAGLSLLGNSPVHMQQLINGVQNLFAQQRQQQHAARLDALRQELEVQRIHQASETELQQAHALAHLQSQRVYADVMRRVKGRDDANKSLHLLADAQRRLREEQEAEAVAKMEAEARAAETARLEAQAKAEAQARLAQARADAEAEAEARARMEAQARAIAQARIDAQARVEAQARAEAQAQLTQDAIAQFATQQAQQALRNLVAPTISIPSSVVASAAVSPRDAAQAQARLQEGLIVSRRDLDHLMQQVAARDALLKQEQSPYSQYLAGRNLASRAQDALSVHSYVQDSEMVRKLIEKADALTASANLNSAASTSRQSVEHPSSHSKRTAEQPVHPKPYRTYSRSSQSERKRHHDSSDIPFDQVEPDAATLRAVAEIKRAQEREREAQLNQPKTKGQGKGGRKASGEGRARITKPRQPKAATGIAANAHNVSKDSRSDVHSSASLKTDDRHGAAGPVTPSITVNHVPESMADLAHLRPTPPMVMADACQPCGEASAESSTESQDDSEGDVSKGARWLDIFVQKMHQRTDMTNDYFDIRRVPPHPDDLMLETVQKLAKEVFGLNFEEPTVKLDNNLIFNNYTHLLRAMRNTDVDDFKAAISEDILTHLVKDFDAYIGRIKERRRVAEEQKAKEAALTRAGIFENLQEPPVVSNGMTSSLPPNDAGREKTKSEDKADANGEEVKELNGEIATSNVTEQNEPMQEESKESDLTEEDKEHEEFMALARERRKRLFPDVHRIARSDEIDDQIDRVLAEAEKRTEPVINYGDVTGKDLELLLFPKPSTVNGRVLVGRLLDITDAKEEVASFFELESSGKRKRRRLHTHDEQVFDDVFVEEAKPDVSEVIKSMYDKTYPESFFKVGLVPNPLPEPPPPPAESDGPEVNPDLVYSEILSSFQHLKESQAVTAHTLCGFSLEAFKSTNPKRYLQVLDEIGFWRPKKDEVIDMEAEVKKIKGEDNLLLEDTAEEDMYKGMSPPGSPTSSGDEFDDKKGKSKGGKTDDEDEEIARLIKKTKKAEDFLKVNVNRFKKPAEPIVDTGVASESENDDNIAEEQCEVKESVSEHSGDEKTGDEKEIAEEVDEDDEEADDEQEDEEMIDGEEEEVENEEEGEDLEEHLDDEALEGEEEEDEEVEGESESVEDEEDDTEVYDEEMVEDETEEGEEGEEEHVDDEEDEDEETEEIEDTEDCLEDEEGEEDEDHENMDNSEELEGEENEDGEEAEPDEEEEEKLGVTKESTEDVDDEEESESEEEDSEEEVEYLDPLDVEPRKFDILDNDVLAAFVLNVPKIDPRLRAKKVYNPRTNIIDKPTDDLIDQILALGPLPGPFDEVDPDTEPVVPHTIVSQYIRDCRKRRMYSDDLWDFRSPNIVQVAKSYASERQAIGYWDEKYPLLKGLVKRYEQEERVEFPLPELPPDSSDEEDEEKAELAEEMANDKQQEVVIKTEEMEVEDAEKTNEEVKTGEDAPATNESAVVKIEEVEESPMETTESTNKSEESEKGGEDCNAEPQVELSVNANLNGEDTQDEERNDKEYTDAVLEVSIESDTKEQADDVVDEPVPEQKKKVTRRKPGRPKKKRGYHLKMKAKAAAADPDPEPEVKKEPSPEEKVAESAAQEAESTSEQNGSLLNGTEIKETETSIEIKAEVVEESVEEPKEEVNNEADPVENGKSASAQENTVEIKPEIMDTSESGSQETVENGEETEKSDMKPDVSEVGNESPKDTTTAMEVEQEEPGPSTSEQKPCIDAASQVSDEPVRCHLWELQGDDRTAYDNFVRHLREEIASTQQINELSGSILHFLKDIIDYAVDRRAQEILYGIPFVADPNEKPLAPPPPPPAPVPEPEELSSQRSEESELHSGDESDENSDDSDSSDDDDSEEDVDMEEEDDEEAKISRKQKS
ncbi:hypothetical protein QR680_002255 [Steinernema hermaphroditum]|uniref:Uncharacterized protein n=1 Tax=Steinernema hermaphroditum TaxID=289476 RepID=A0AA39LHY9_9BILA|nr:hypothetical protein QR680_002255 [Steinernema hermaphroditum]